MASIGSPSLNTNDPPREHCRVPGNVYYVMPYYHHFLCVYVFLGSLLTMSRHQQLQQSFGLALPSHAW